MNYLFSTHQEKKYNSENVTWWEIFVMFLVLSLSGNPYINGQEFEVFIVVSSIIPIIYIFKNHKKPISFRTILIFTFLLGYEIMHAVMFKLDYSLTIFKITLVLLLAVTMVSMLKDRFVMVLTKTMVIISYVSFIFVLICYVPGISTWLYDFADKLFPIDNDWKGYHTPTLLVFTFHPEFFWGQFSYVRNAGIFWESGAFAVYLNIALFLHYSTRSIKTFKDLFDKDAMVLIIALISTTSTMGILVMISLLTYFSIQLKTALKYVLIVVIGIISYAAYTTVEFLGNKINQQLEQSDVENNRFGAALLDIQDIAKRPILGWSRRNEVVFGTTKFTGENHRPNGVTNLVRSYGLLYSSFYFFMVFTSFVQLHIYFNKSVNYSTPAFGILLLLMVAFSEIIFDMTFLKSLMFLYSTHYSAHLYQQNPNNKEKSYIFSIQPISTLFKRA